MEGGAKKVEEFDVFLAVALANIWGLDDVLTDRTIPLILEKSDDPLITKIPEYFVWDDRIAKISKTLLESVSVVSVVSVMGVENRIENLQKMLFLQFLNARKEQLTQHTPPPQLTQPAQPAQEQDIDTLIFLDKIKGEPRLFGRNFELWLPLLITAHLIGSKVLDDAIALACESVETRNIEDSVSDIDVTFSAFLLNYSKDEGNYTPNSFLRLKNIASEFSAAEGLTDKNGKSWFNSEKASSYLKRMGLRTKSKRDRTGALVKINRDKLKRFLVIKEIIKEGEDEVTNEEEQPTGQPGIKTPCEICQTDALCTLNKAGQRVCPSCAKIPEPEI